MFVLFYFYFFICPAYAGMIPLFVPAEEQSIDLSRVCGDDPGRKTLKEVREEFVPRMRG